MLQLPDIAVDRVLRIACMGSSLAGDRGHQGLAELVGLDPALTLVLEEADERGVAAKPVAELAREPTVEPLKIFDRDAEGGGKVRQTFGRAAVAFDVADERCRDADGIGEGAQRQAALLAQEADGIADRLDMRRELEGALGHEILEGGEY